MAFAQIHSFRENDGAPVGDYNVTFTWPKEAPSSDPDQPGETVDQLKGAYSHPERSRFHATVTEGKNQLEPFELK